MSMPNNTLNSSLLPHRAKVHIVKVYSLAEPTGTWAYVGTGAFVYLQCNRGDRDEFFVESLLTYFETVIHIETNLEWSHLDRTLMTLRFENAEARDDVWRCILNKADISLRTRNPIDLPGDGDADTVILNELTLPTPTMENLDSIIKIIKDTTTPDEKDRLVALIIRDDYVRKMFSFFEKWDRLDSVSTESERLKKIDCAHQLFTIIKSIFLLHDIDVIRYLLHRHNILLVISLLEYDTATPTKKANHRKILEGRSRIISSTLDQPFERYVLQAYRIEYLKDILMEQHLDEPLLSMLQSQIPYEHITALHWVQNDVGFLENIFKNLTCDKTSEINRTKAIQTMLHICTFSKSLPASSQLKLCRTLVPYGLFTAIEIAVSSDDSRLRTAGAAALCSIEDAAAPLSISHLSSLQLQGDTNNDTNNDYAGNNRRDLLPGGIDQSFKTTSPELDNENYVSPLTPPQQIKHKRLDDNDDDDDASPRHVKHRRLNNDKGKGRSKGQDIQRTKPSPTFPAAISSPPTSPSLGSHSMCTRQKQRQQQQRQQQQRQQQQRQQQQRQQQQRQQQQRQQQHQQQDQPFDEWMGRINRLETNASQSSHRLQQSMVNTAERLDAFERLVARQAHERTTSRRHLEQQIGQVLRSLSTLTQQNQQREQ
ncbi:hypothetical protein [Absidia glauca]|uniref:Serine/threonine-protein phosphatase 4 regulatory subunit 3-like central domain-containing protein n=1 Tax=Absidia glauca TaxID=4829 RepID=A0A168SYL3_ABSGL|nr:hypothetical protein [Absidia glauca]